MTTCRVFSASLLVVFVLAVGSVSASIISVGSEEASAWARYLVPLPRSLSITAKVQLDPATVAVYLPTSPDIVATEAGAELWQSMGLSGTHSNPAHPAFAIRLQLGGAESVPLNALKNSGQAYLIFPETGNTGLRIVALASRGLYYGAKTVEQLVIAYGTAGGVKIPILNVTDWPELTDRGLWGNDSFDRTRWMGDRKMNYLEELATNWYDNCVPHAGPRPGYDQMHIEGPYYGLEPGHCVLHLDQQDAVFTCYPMLMPVGDSYPSAWCYSQPKAVDVIADWICDLKALPYQKDVDVWMSENLHGKGGCKCAQCVLTNRSQLEARTIISAWKKAMQTAGPVGIRMLTSEATRSDNQYIVQELQSDPTAKIWHYDSLITYLVREQPIVDPYIEQWAESGHYAGEVPLLSPSASYFSPWTCPQFIYYRMQESKNKSISGLMGYPTPGIPGYRFNVEAAAEWSWNPDGRSVREFTESWAVRQGLNPKTFADWVDLLGPVSWDVYGSEFPGGIVRKNQNSGPIATALQNGTLQDIGQVKLTIYPCPWGDIKTLDQLNEDVTAATKALTLAKAMNPEFYYESLAIHGWITALRALYELKSLVVGGAVDPANRTLAANYFYIYVAGMKEAADACPKWATAINLGYDVEATVNICTAEESQMTQLASDLGCPISSSPMTLVPATSIPEAKKCADGTFASLGSEVITSTANGSYVQEVGGPPAGIKVQSSLPMTADSPCIVMGTLGTTNGERYINATMVLPVTDALSARPVGMRTSSVGGGAFGLQPAVSEYRGGLASARGTNNTGMLVRIAGKVTAQGSNYFYVDDGCDCDDGSGSFGVRVISGNFTKPSVGSWVTATGPSSTYYERGHTWRAVVLPGSGSWSTVLAGSSTAPAAPTSPSANPASITVGGSSTLSASVESGCTVDWHSGSCGGPLAGSGASLVVSPTNTTAYCPRARNTSNGQVSDNCGNAVTVTVSAAPVVLLNGSFEADSNSDGLADNWTSYVDPTGTAAFTRGTMTPPAGAYYQQTQVTTANKYAGVRQTVSGCTIGGVYTIAGYYRTNSASATVSVRVDPAGGTIRPSSAIASTTGNSFAAFSGNVTATAASMTIFLDTTVTTVNKAGCFDAITVTAQ